MKLICFNVFMQANLQALENEVAELRDYKLKAIKAEEDFKLQNAALSHQLISLRVDLEAKSVWRIQLTNCE